MEVRLPDRIAVACPTEEEARTFISALAEYTGVRWYSGNEPSQFYLNWGSYKTSTTYTIEYGRVSYGSGKYAREQHIPIVSMAEFLSWFGLGELDEDDVGVDLSGLL